MSRILWLTTADARGHLMRCQLLCRELKSRGHLVQVVTTSREGQAFLRAFGVEAALLSEHYRVEFDQRQNMARWRTEWRLIRYFLAPGRFARDIRWIRQRAAGMDLVVNDSFHPALLVAPLLGKNRVLPPVVHIYGKNLRSALEHNFTNSLPRFIADRFRALMATCTDRAFARIEHSVVAHSDGLQTALQMALRTFSVPCVVASPSRPAGEVRAMLGVPANGRLAVIYLNPHFRDPLLAQALEQTLSMLGFFVHGVAEGFASRPGWRAYDTQLADAIGAADLFISAPGLGALTQARSLGIPFLALTTDQPEQAANLRLLRPNDLPLEIVYVDSKTLAGDLADAAQRLVEAPRRSGSGASSALRIWMDVLEKLSVVAASKPAERESRWKAA